MLTNVYYSLLVIDKRDMFKTRTHHYKFTIEPRVAAFCNFFSAVQNGSLNLLLLTMAFNLTCCLLFDVIFRSRLASFACALLDGKKRPGECTQNIDKKSLLPVHELLSYFQSIVRSSLKTLHLFTLS